ncbi:MAG TPA: tetratricopeptide repeat protein [Polyangiaceae bacterium]|nr:tetratricopeptide repeat protein [Polyangiaceae bacterium]
MLRRLVAGGWFASLSGLAVSAAAQPPAAAAAQSATGIAAEPATAVKREASEVRRDPRGIKGISPFMEAIKRGDAALLARDIEAAVVAYRDALAQEPENALAYYRIAEAQILKGDLKEAETALVAGLRAVVATNASLKAKLQFALADLRERQKAYDEASARWAEYEAFTTTATTAATATERKDSLGFPASGAERKKVVEAWKKLSADSADVKARIEKGMKAADEAVRKSSK